MLSKTWCVLLVIVCYGCSPSSGEKSLGNSLDSYFSDQFPGHEPGVAVLIMKDQKTIYSGGFGMADLKLQQPISTNTLFNIGSVSKTFVSNGILILAERGKLTLDDPLIRYFHGFRNTTIPRRVTLRHLLTHTSGLPDNRDVAGDSVFYLTARDEENWAPVYWADSLRFIPGSRVEYSNPAYNGLALVIEKVSGKKWQEFIFEQVMKPSGMLTSTITDGPHPQEGVAHGYVSHQGAWIEDDYGEEPTFAAAGNGGVWSSVEELALYEMAHRKALFLPEKTIRESRTVQPFTEWKNEPAQGIGWSWFQPADHTAPFVGFSWFIVTRQDQIKVIGHTGTQGGFQANYVTLPDHDLFFVLLSNRPVSMEALSEKVIGELTRFGFLEV